MTSTFSTTSGFAGEISEISSLTGFSIFSVCFSTFSTGGRDNFTEIYFSFSSFCGIGTKIEHRVKINQRESVIIKLKVSLFFIIIL